MKRVMIRSLLLAVLLASPLAGSTSPYGLNIHAPSGPGLGLLLDRVAAAGVPWVRVDFVWAFVQPAPGVWDWTLYDNLVAAAEARGLEVLATIAYTPAWATDGPVLAGVPRSVVDWETFCFRAGERYRNRIRHWEIWNEPNLSHFWDGSRSQYLSLILEPGLLAVRAGGGDVKVGGPGLAHLVSGNTDWYRWLTAVLERVGPQLDFISHHAYDDDARGLSDKLDESTLFGSFPDFWDVAPPSLIEVLEHEGVLGVPVWLTETGWASDEVGEPAQAAELTDFLGRWLTGSPDRSWIYKFFVYELIDDPTPGVRKFGLLRPNRSPKPAYTALRDFVAAHPAGPGDASALLLDDRFEVEVRWQEPSGETGSGRAVSFSDQTAYFWFFQPANIELLVKVLDGRPINGHFWVYYGALSDVDYWITVTDRVDGRVLTYRNRQGDLCGLGDVNAFLPQRAGGQASAAAASELRLREGRFRVTVDWTDHLGRSGTGTAIPATDDSGFFWFFQPENLELVVKVLDGRGVNGYFWVYYGALSDVRYTVRVSDLQTGAERLYLNPLGEQCGRGDVQAFLP